MAGPPGPAPGTSSSSSSLPSRRRRRPPPRLGRRRGGDDQQPPHPPKASSEALPCAASPPARCRGGDHQPPHPPEAALEALRGAASPPARRRGGDLHPSHPPEAASEALRGAASPPERRRGGDRQPSHPTEAASEAPSGSASPPARRRGGDQQPPPAVAVAVTSEGGVGPRRSFRISLRHRVRVVPWVKPPVARKPKDPAKPPRPSIEALAAEWAKEKAASGAPEEECVLPFLQKDAPKKVECLVCSKSILPDDKMCCSVRDCDAKLHKACSEKGDGCCPRHDAGPTDGIEEAFRRLPLPHTFQEFNIDPIKKEELDNGTEPPPYVHMKRNLYLVKNKCDDDSIEGGCTNCLPDFTCKLSCSCRSLLVSCSRACHCSDECTNKPFRRQKKIEIVKTQYCGWGSRALEAIEKDDFVIEFVGEVIDDETCEERLEDMRRRGDKNFYMCKVKKDFVIDATFKGNDCRFFNHSCEPNCQLQKWQVNGKTRLGVFASKAIEVGEPLTYDYRFEQHYGPEIECFCGAQNCQGNMSVSGKD
ncbi:histone-lysine N-methyltransferase ASHR3 [Oryza sativa Japonica Group]|nr:histone-lysine N-methyltransferase ASHR3 isoform X2 [Oryza sativa Japonica Group]